MRIKGKRFITTIGMVILIVSSMQGVTTVAAEETKNEVSEEVISGEIEVVLNRSKDLIEPYIDMFEEKYPQVKVKYTCYNDFENEIKPRIEEGNYGDVLYFPDFVANEEAMNYFEPLGTMEELSQKYNYLDQGCYHDNVIYGIPSSAYLIGLLYNKEVFDTAGITSLPKTIDDFMYAMYLINENTDAIPFYSGYSDPWVLGNWEVFPFVEMSGKASYKFNEFLNDENPFREGTYHNQTLKLLYELVKNGYTEVGGDKIGWWDSLIKMNNGEIGCSVIGTWALYDYKNVGPNGDNIEFMPFPNNIEGEQYVTVAGNYSYAISKNSRNKAAAKAFLDFLLDESGFAFDHDTISVLKTDPYPECYGNMTDVKILNSVGTSSEAYSLYSALSTNLSLYNVDEYVRIIEAAAGISSESFEAVMSDWNMRWEAGLEGKKLDSVSDNEEKSEENAEQIGKKEVEFSDNEKKFIQESPELIVGYNRNLAPISFEENGEFSGVAYDVCKLISDKSGIKMRYKSYNNTDELLEALDKGEIDFIAGVDKLNTYNTLRYSKDYLQYLDVIVRYNTVNASSLKKYVGAVGEKYAKNAEVKENESCQTVDRCIEKVADMKADFTITNFYSANYYIRKNRYDDVTVIPYAKNQTYHIGFGEDTNPTLIAICNKCIYSLEDGELEILLMQYMDSIVQKVTLWTIVKIYPVTCILIISSIFLLVCSILFERYRNQKKQVLAAKKYELLAFQAEECIFEYNYKTKKFDFDSNFVHTLGCLDFDGNQTSADENTMMNQFYKNIKVTLEEAQDAQFTMVLDDDKNEKQWFRVIVSAIYNKKKQPVHMLGKLVSIQKEMEEVANYQNRAYTDALTKVYNREGLFAHLPSEANGVMLAVLDIDDFKQVNDTLGHAGGDYALMYLADRLEQHMGTKSLVARYGGDEFVVMLTGINENEAKDRLSELVKSMDVSLRYDGNSRKLSISAGAVYSDRLKSFDDMFHEADKVLYKMKEEGKNNYKMEFME